MGARKEERVSSGGCTCEGGHCACGCDPSKMEVDSIPQGVTVEPKASHSLDIQVGGDHYKKLAIQPIEYIHANDIPFIEGNIIKYITRWKQKGGTKDIEKVIHYAQILLELNS